MRRVAGLKSDAFVHLLQLLQLYAKSLRSLRYIGACPKGKAFSVKVFPLGLPGLSF